MDMQNTSHLFHLFVKLNYDITHYKVLFSKPRCLCFTSLPKHLAFWIISEDLFNKLNDLVSLSLQILCETNDCLCLDRVYPVFNDIFQWIHPLLMTFNNYENHQQQGLTQTMVENTRLSCFLESCLEDAQRKIEHLNYILSRCDVGHYNLLSKYSVCAMCE